MAKKKPTTLSVFRDFYSLTPDEQYVLALALMDAPRNPFAAELHNQRQDADVARRRMEAAAKALLAKIPKKKGNPARDEIILRKAATMSDGQIAKDPEAVAAHTGKKKLTAKTVQGVRRRHGLIKK